MFVLAASLTWAAACEHVYIVFLHPHCASVDGDASMGPMRLSMMSRRMFETLAVSSMAWAKPPGSSIRHNNGVSCSLLRRRNRCICVELLPLLGWAGLGEDLGLLAGYTPKSSRLQ